MESNSDESSKFVCLIVEQKDVLIKSRVVELTKRKETAAAEIIKKWAEIAGKTLTQAGLYKKINNFKSRAKLALSSGKQLTDWQSKLLKIVGANISTDDDEEIPISDLPESSSANISGSVASSKSGATQFLDEHETPETKFLNNEQLHRLVLLKQVKVLTLQQQRLERMEGSAHAENGKDVEFEYIGWEGANQNKV